MAPFVQLALFAALPLVLALSCPPGEHALPSGAACISMGPVSGPTVQSNA